MGGLGGLGGPVGYGGGYVVADTGIIQPQPTIVAGPQPAFVAGAYGVPAYEEPRTRFIEVPPYGPAPQYVVPTPQEVTTVVHPEPVTHITSSEKYV